MRVIIPNYRLPDSFVDNVAYTLEQMGHQVLTAPRPTSLIDQRLYHIIHMVTDKLAPTRLTYQEKWLLKSYREFKPDLVLCLTLSINEEILLELRKAGIRTVAWWGDTPANMTRYGLLCKGWDFIFIKDKYAAFKLKTLDLPAFYLPEAMNPAWHKWNFSNINNSLIFAGNAYDYRHYLLRRLLEDGRFPVKLYGNRPPRWADPAVKALFLGKFVIREEKSEVFGSGLACINSTAMSEGNSLNCRAFEIAGAGGLQIMEYREAMEDCFEPGKEILGYSSFEELVQLADRASKDPDWALLIRKNGYRRAHSEHTYEQRMNTIFRYLSVK